MARLTVNGVEVEVAEGATVLEAAQRAGAEVPTLCYMKSIGAIASCMVCVVKDQATGQMAPACSAKAADGMRIDTAGEEVRAARREILQMLLSEHVGDCDGPCSRGCPAALNIPRMLRHIASGNRDAAARLAKRDLIFPATLGCLCHAPCENSCRRSAYDAPIAIRGLHRETRERLLRDAVSLDACAPATGKTLAIVGAGIAGLSAAWRSLRQGHECRVYEKRSVACESLRSMHHEQLPQEILDAEINSVRDLGAEFVFHCEVGRDVPLESLCAEFDAVIVACDLESPDDTGVFTAEEDAMPVWAVAHGKAAAHRADAFLRGLESDAASRRFNSQIGGLEPDELSHYAVERINGDSNHLLEAGRCLHCDCLKAVSCRLRRYAEEYGLGARAERHMKRPRVEPIQRFDEVLFEPGKCIKCGICIGITQAAAKGTGLTFVGRGLATRVHVPFGQPLAQGLGEVALECVRACPTGALALRNEEDTA